MKKPKKPTTDERIARIDSALGVTDDKLADLARDRRPDAALVPVSTAPAVEVQAPHVTIEHADQVVIQTPPAPAVPAPPPAAPPAAPRPSISAATLAEILADLEEPATPQARAIAAAPSQPRSLTLDGIDLLATTAPPDGGTLAIVGAAFLGGAIATGIGRHVAETEASRAVAEEAAERAERRASFADAMLARERAAMDRERVDTAIQTARDATATANAAANVAAAGGNVAAAGATVGAAEIAASAADRMASAADRVALAGDRAQGAADRVRDGIDAHQDHFDARMDAMEARLERGGVEVGADDGGTAAADAIDRLSDEPTGGGSRSQRS